MFDKSGSLRYKKEAQVTVALAGQAPFDASVFLKVDERLIDLLNDDRSFIPVKRGDGSTIIIAKSNIVSIIENSRGDEPGDGAASPGKKRKEPDSDGAERSADSAKSESQEKAPPWPPRFKRTYNPYDVLRVSPQASMEEIRKAYKSRIKAVHPDTIAALDLDDDLERAAILAAQKVNHAYQAILKDRKAAENSNADSNAV